MDEFPQEWNRWRGPAPVPPKGMRWVAHPFDRHRMVLDAELPRALGERVGGWIGWKVIGGVLAMVAWGLFLMLIGAN